MSDNRLGTLMVAMFPGDKTNFIGEVSGIADHPTLMFKRERGECQKRWAAHLCRTATQAEQIDYWRARALKDGWDGSTERRDGNDHRRTYGRREIDSQ